jgi:rhodanese-related sulfurtransferase
MKNKTVFLIIGVIIITGGLFALSQLGSANLVQEIEEHHEDDDDVVREFEIYPGDVVEKIKNKEDVILLDVRTLEEYEEIHLQNALLLPVQELSAQSLTGIGLGPNAKDKEIIIYCRSGSRSETAYNIMNSLGYTNIKSVAGGMIHWEEDEYPFTEVGEYTSDNVAPQATNATGAKASLDRTLHDFGEITQYGGVVTADFIITNNGSENLAIGDITTSCSCTSATVASKSVAPGGQTTLTVVFDPDFHEEPLGVFKRTVFIPTNDPNTLEAEVAVQVDIIEGK